MQIAHLSACAKPVGKLVRNGPKWLRPLRRVILADTSVSLFDFGQ